MLRALTFIAVWQKADEAGHTKPFTFTGRDELVEENLRAVCEVTELGFPERKRIRVRQRVAILIAKNRFLGEEGIDDFVFRLVFADIVQRRVRLFCFLVDNARMALGERATTGVLTGQTDREAFIEKRTECEVLCGCPIEAFAAFDRILAAINDARERSVRCDTFRDCCDRRTNAFQRIDFDGCVAAAFIALWQAKA